MPKPVKARVEIVPVDGLRTMLDAIGQRAVDSIEEQGLVRLGNVLEAKAVELAPVDTGNLESSSIVVTLPTRGAIMGVEVRFDAPYAATVHELPEEIRGPKTRRKPGNEYGPAGPKYLERPLRGFQRELTENLGEFLQRIWGAAAAKVRRRNSK